MSNTWDGTIIEIIMLSGSLLAFFLLFVIAGFVLYLIKALIKIANKLTHGFLDKFNEDDLVSLVILIILAILLGVFLYVKFIRVYTIAEILAFLLHFVVNLVIFIIFAIAVFMILILFSGK